MSHIAHNDTEMFIFIVGIVIPALVVIWGIVHEQVVSYKAKKAKKKSDKSAPSSWVDYRGYECDNCGNEYLRTPPRSSGDKLMYDKEKKDIIIKSSKLYYCPTCDEKMTNRNKERYDPENWIRRKSKLDGYFGGYEYCEEHGCETPLASKTETRRRSTKISGGNGMKARSTEEVEVTVSECLLCLRAEGKTHISELG